MRYYLICIFLCAPCLIKAQSAIEYIVIGDSLYANNENDNASLMYERAYFYSTEVQISAEAILKKVECLKKKGAFREVKQQLDKISFSILPTELHPRWHYEIAYSAFCSKEFDRAENQIKLYLK